MNLSSFCPFFPIFPLFPDFSLFFLISPIFFPILANFLLPHWLRYWRSVPNFHKIAPMSKYVYTKNELRGLLLAGFVQNSP